MAENKLLTESLEALLSGDINAAKRKFDNYYGKVSQNAYKLLESEDFEDFDGDAEEIVSDVVDTQTDEEVKFDDILAAVSELEGKYPADMTDELVARFDELKNRIDDLRLCEEEDCDDLVNDALIALEDLKGDFEVVDGMSDEVVDLFNEIGDKLSDEDGEDDVEAAADADVPAEGELEDEKELTEAFEEKKDVKLSEEGEPELEMSEEDEVVKEPAGNVEAAPAFDDDRSVEDLINDAEDNAADMTELLRSLKAEMAEDEQLDESAEMKKVNVKAKAEAAGVVKNGMKMPRPAKVDTEARLDGSKAGSKGKAVDTNVGKVKAENEAEKMKPVQKPSNKGVAGKSVLG